MVYAMAAMAAMKLADSYFASDSIKMAAENNRFIAETNAEFAELDAYDAKIEGKGKQAGYQKKIDMTLADQNALMAAKNISTTTGTGSAIKSETNFTAELNLMEIEKQYEEKALGYRQEARNFRTQGALQYSSDQGRASDVMRSGVLGASETLIKGYGDYKKSSDLTDEWEA